MSKETDSPLSIKYFLSYAVAATVAVVAVVSLAYVTLPTLLSVSYSANILGATSSPNVVAAPYVQHLPTPKPLKAIYMSQCVAGTPSFRDSLVKFIDDTALNAVVIDIKDFSGGIAFPTENAILAGAVSDECGASDMKEFVERLHAKNIYVIGRITVFQDPHYTSVHPEQAVQKKSGGVWKDHKGLAFVDVGAKPFWDYMVELGKESYELGFDELNFDYIRFPSDGNMAEADYTWSAGKSKAQALEEFYKYLTENLRSPSISSGQVPVLSADLFGYVTVHQDDLGIGQVLERGLPYFDYIYPMVYPSHYNNGFTGLADVNSDPYKVVYTSLVGAVLREVATTTRQPSFAFIPIASTSPQLYEKPVYSGKVIPWLQGFDYPVHYSPEMVSAQIEATNDAGIESYLFWDAANKYTSLRSVLSATATVQ
ncbi:hypothetical protein A2943_00195 [Candidatus Adlerbacteria bacterium RIFCSPLOWO2_01_FULL_51_16]|uniref:DUF4015 domain-containing protein n=1 Tax=Candidatus Adlerbacteria bacterium RIFCSPLOWO2_01_FULL_51_16 TaxID=1797243 RepID=A0A1F4XGI7_9BACT|nr:MAG: hypothetical protein A2943_00195 [Candidatus Adlerbacteria bacterium RIFCSPLOWO2_01_FULL_51_16]